MKLLILTQKVDRDDDVLGFFHEWLRAFASRAERVEVICLFEGAHDLPKNVAVYSLGKECGAGRIVRLLRLYRYLWRLGGRYDAVFVHMNEEYVLLGGWWWRLCGKKVVLWRNHKMGSWRTRLAAQLASIACHTSPDAFVARYAKAVRMPIGIDTDFFVPPPVPPAPDTALFLGRLDPVKKVEVFVGALALLKTPVRADIYGSPTDPDSAYAKQLAARVTIHPGVPHAQTRELYQTHALYVNLTPSGSFDKTIGEAMASGCLVVCANEALRGVLPDALLCSGTAESVAKALEYALGMSHDGRAALQKTLREYVEREHSLRLLMDKIRTLYDL